MPTWKIVIHADNIESFYTVLKACDQSDGIRIEHAGMVEQEVKVNHRRSRAGRSGLPLKFVADSAPGKFFAALKKSGTGSITVEDAVRWAMANDVAAGSASYLIRTLMLFGKLAKSDETVGNKNVYNVKS